MKTKKKQKNNTMGDAILFVVFIVTIVILCFYLFPKNKEEPKDISFICNEGNARIKIGEKRKINYDVNVDYEIEWISSNDVVTVTDDTIIANKYGQAVLTGVLNDGNNIITSTCTVTTYTGDIGVSVRSIDVNDGYLLMQENSSYDHPFVITPSNAYIESIEYYSVDENIALFSDNKVLSRNSGSTIVSMVVNNAMAKDLDVLVEKDVKINTFVKNVDDVTFKVETVTLTEGETKELTYKIEPRDGYINSIKWISSNEDVVSVDNGVIKAIKSGVASVQVIINNRVLASTKVIVNAKTITPAPIVTPSNDAVILVEKKPKETIKIGETTDIIAQVIPKGSNKKIAYISSNTKVATVDNNGVIKGVGAGSTTITLFIGNSNAKYFKITVIKNSPTNTPPVNNKYVWGYTSSKAKTPLYANQDFFQLLANQGRGILNNNTYYLSSSYGQFSYDIKNSLLVVDGVKKVKVRVFYPPETDLSNANTLVYMGGDGESEFGGYFANIGTDASIVRSSGILILVAQASGTSFDGDSAICATRFVQAITNQKPNVRNSVLGFSTGGKFVLDASNKYNYYKTIIFSSWSPDPASTVNVKNKDVMYFIPYGDGLYRLAKETLVKLRDYGYQHVTLVTNSNELLNMFSGSNFELINPGSGMKTAHVSANVGLSGVIAYVND